MDQLNVLIKNLAKRGQQFQEGYSSPRAILKVPPAHPPRRSEIFYYSDKKRNPSTGFRHQKSGAFTERIMETTPE